MVLWYFPQKSFIHPGGAIPFIWVQFTHRTKSIFINTLQMGTWTGEAIIQIPDRSRLPEVGEIFRWKIKASHLIDSAWNTEAGSAVTLNAGARMYKEWILITQRVKSKWIQKVELTEDTSQQVSEERWLTILATEWILTCNKEYDGLSEFARA